MSFVNSVRARATRAPVVAMPNSNSVKSDGYRIKSGAEAVVSAFDVPTGSKDKFSPAFYGDYITKSNNVYACAGLRATMLSALPIKMYRRQGQKKTLIEKGALFDLFQDINPDWTPRRLIDMTELSLCLWGESYWFADRGVKGSGAPKELWWVKPTKVFPVQTKKSYIDHYLYEYEDGKFQKWPKDEVVWLRYSNPIDQLAPLSPLAAARIYADYERDSMNTNQSLHKQGLTAGGFIFPKIGQWTPDQVEQIEDSVNRRFTGVDKAHRWGAFRQEVQIHSSPLTPREAEFLGGLDLTLEAVARSYRVPIDLVGGKRTYQNIHEANKQLWYGCLIPEAQFIAGELVEQMAQMDKASGINYFEFDLSDVLALQKERNEQWETDNSKIKSGVLTINEFRKREGESPVPWGDVWWPSEGFKGGPIDDLAEDVIAQLERKALRMNIERQQQAEILAKAAALLEERSTQSLSKDSSEVEVKEDG